MAKRASPLQIVGAVSLIMGLVFSGIVVYHGAVTSTFARDGVTTTATVHKVFAKKEKNIHGGKTRSTIEYYASVSFFTDEGKAGATQAAPGKGIQLTPGGVTLSLEKPGNYHAADVSLTEEQFERLGSAKKLEVVYLPDDPAEVRLLESVEGYDPTFQITLAGMLLLAGIVLLFVARRKASETAAVSARPTNRARMVALARAGDWINAESLRDDVTREDVLALEALYWKLDSWQGKCTIVQLVQDDYTDELQALMRDVLRAPDGDDDMVPVTRAIALSHLEHDPDAFVRYFDDPKAAKVEAAKYL